LSPPAWPSTEVLLGGMPDHYTEQNGGTMTNYKVTTVYKARMLERDGPESSMEWVAAENCYAYLMRRHGFTVSMLQVCLVLRDWTEREYLDQQNKYHCTVCRKQHMRDSKPGMAHAEHEDVSMQRWYPATQLYVCQLPCWSQGDAEHYVTERLRIHLQAKDVPDLQLPQCTNEETWSGRRCERYCEVASFCCQRASLFGG